MTAEQRASMYMLEEKKDKTLSDYKLLVEWKDKQIEELEEENAKLREELNYAKTHCLFHSDCLAQKENAELKQINSETLAQLNLDNGELITELTKAKEIISEYMRFEPMIGTCSFYSEEYKKTKTKAEQFLNENSAYERIQKAKHNYAD